MTLKTTKEQRDALLIYIDDPNATVYNTVTLYNSVVRDLCHDADRAEELEKEVARLDDGWTEATEVSNAFYAQTCKLQEENAGLRAKLEGAKAALKRIAEGADAPDIDATGEWQFGLHCGVEDRQCSDRYQGADYGHAVGASRMLDWATNEATGALKEQEKV